MNWKLFFNEHGSQYIQVSRDRILTDGSPPPRIQVEELYKMFAQRYAAEHMITGSGRQITFMLESGDELLNRLKKDDKLSPDELIQKITKLEADLRNTQLENAILRRQNADKVPEETDK